MYDTSETIVAVSTPIGQAPRAIVRASGSRALPVAATVFRSRSTPIAELGGFRTVAGQVRCADLALPARAYVFRGPHSYTRQDLVELHIVGHPIAGRMLVDAMVAAGARVAEPGEFTRRAFLSGRIDLSAAEAVAEVIAAATDAELRAAQANAAGALGTLCRSWTREVAESLAEIEASIDVAEEGLQLAAPAAMAQRLDGLADRMANVARDAVSPPAAADIPRVVMTGATNVGKSSLLNALTGLDRAIVSATAGTTRDVLSAPLALGEGREVLLIDPAGLTDQSHPIAAAANRAARSALAAADLVMHVLDATDPDPRIPDMVGERSDRSIVVLNKVDLLATGELESICSEMRARTGRVVLSCSARTGLGLATLVERLGDELHTQSARTASPCAMHDRQRNSVLRAVTALREAALQAEPLEHLADRAEILAVDLRSAIADLGAITGDAISEEILGRIFQRFCVGK